MPNKVPASIARERNRILRELATQKNQAFMRGFIGQTIEAITLGSDNSFPSRAKAADSITNRFGLFEGSAACGTSPFTEALTDNYLKLRLKGHHQPNRWLQVKVEDVEDGSLVGHDLTDTTNLDSWPSRNIQRATVPCSSAL